jgi:hypothetical protein
MSHWVRATSRQYPARERSPWCDYRSAGIERRIAGEIEA